MSVDLSTKSVVLIGAGSMGSALLRGWLDAGLSPSRTIACDRSPSDSLKALAETKGVRLTSSPERNFASSADAVVLAVKPKGIVEAMSAFRNWDSPRPLFLSVAAGISLATLESQLAVGASVARAMPNTPSSVRKGMSLVVSGDGVDDEGRALARALMSAVGDAVESDDERMIDAATAISGSGPAYFFSLVESMASAGESMGLSSDSAMRLARGTAIGAAALLESSEESASTLRRNVTSPNGTTAAALVELNDDERGLGSLMRRAMGRAYDRARELGKEAES